MTLLVKNAKRRGPPLEVSPDERVKQFKGDLSGDGGILLCKFCDHSLDYVPHGKDHLQSKSIF